MREDEIVKETRRLRDEYAKQFNYNLDLIFEDLLKKQKESGSKTRLMLFIISSVGWSIAISRYVALT